MLHDFRSHLVQPLVALVEELAGRALLGARRGGEGREPNDWHRRRPHVECRWGASSGSSAVHHRRHARRSHILLVRVLLDDALKEVNTERDKKKAETRFSKTVHENRSKTKKRSLAEIKFK